VREFQKAVYGDRFKPTIIVTDNDTGLRNSISTVWPSVLSLLCRWHINKNVLTKAQETWRVNGLDEEERKRNESLRDAFMERWINVTYSKTKESFEEAYRQLKNDYSEQPALLEYLDEFKYSTKELYVEAYTSEFKHYGVTVTSRIEGGHSCLKKFLGTSKSDIFGVVKVISMLHTEQYDKIRDELAQSRDLIAHDINAKLPANTWMDPGINRKVVPLGLKKLKQQVRAKALECGPG
jgi:histone-lysine N-methyltransferase SETD2